MVHQMFKIQGWDLGCLNPEQILSCDVLSKLTLMSVNKSAGTMQPLP